MEMAFRARDSVQIIDLEGALDLYETPRVKKEVNRLVAEGHNEIVLNLANVTLMDSSGIGALMTLHSDLSSAGASLVLAQLPSSVSSSVRQGLSQLVPIFDTEDDALALFSG